MPVAGVRGVVEVRLCMGYGSDGELYAASARILSASLHFILTPTIWVLRLDVFHGVRCSAEKLRISLGRLRSHAHELELIDGCRMKATCRTVRFYDPFSSSTS